MNRHGKAALTRLLRAGVRFELPADADVIVRLHELGAAIDDVRVNDDDAILNPCYEAHGLTFWRLSIAARRFLLSEVAGVVRTDREAFLARAWCMTLPRRPDAFAPYIGRPRTIRDAIREFERTCPVSESELIRIVDRLDPPPQEVPDDGNAQPADVGTVIEMLVHETGLPAEYWAFEASEQMVTVLFERAAERQRRAAQARSGRVVAEDGADRFNRARRRLMEYEAEVRARGAAQPISERGRSP